MKLAADFRREARAAMSEGQYWPYLGAYIVLSLVLILVAIPSILLLFIPVLYFAGLMTWSLKQMALASARREMNFDMLFSGWGHGWHMLGILAVKGIYIFLWTLLLIVPGIIKQYSYAMTEFIAVEHPDWTANMCITESRRLMDGNKWRFFCMNFSFFGWWFLVVLSALLNIQSLTQMLLVPYIELATVDFYNTIKQEKGPAYADADGNLIA